MFRAYDLSLPAFQPVPPVASLRPSTVKARRFFVSLWEAIRHTATTRPANMPWLLAGCLASLFPAVYLLSLVLPPIGDCPPEHFLHLPCFPLLGTLGWGALPLDKPLVSVVQLFSYPFFQYNGFWLVLWLWQVVILCALVESSQGYIRVFFVLVAAHVSGATLARSTGVHAPAGTVVFGAGVTTFALMGAWIADLVVAPSQSEHLPFKLASVIWDLSSLIIHGIWDPELVRWTALAHVGSLFGGLLMGLCLFPGDEPGTCTAIDVCGRRVDANWVRTLHRLPRTKIRISAAVILGLWLFVATPVAFLAGN